MPVSLARAGLASMTGFGRAEAGSAVVEIRTVNHRFLEVETRLPEGLQGFEEAVRSAVARAIRRGQVRVSIVLKSHEAGVPVVVDERMAQAYVRQMDLLRRRLRISGELSLQTLLGLPHVLRPADRTEPASGWRPVIERAVRRALAELVRTRRREGDRLGRALRALLGEMESLAGSIRRRAPQVERQLEKRLSERVRLLAHRMLRREPDRGAILSEIADFVRSSDVREELDRIGSHLTALRAAANGSKRGAEDRAESPGRTLDFLAQELHREVNTLGTKLRDPRVTRWVVQMKGRVEKLREQAANLE